MNEIFNLIKSAPEWVALSVAMGGLGFQQWQIKHLQSRLSHCTEFITKRQEAIDGELRELYRKLLKRTDLT